MKVFLGGTCNGLLAEPDYPTKFRSPKNEAQRK